MLVNPNEIEKIIFGCYQGELFIGVDTLTLTHTQSNSYSLLTFSDSLQVPDSLSSVTTGLKYVLTNFDPVIIKKDFFLFSYPYESTKIVFYFNPVVIPKNGGIQDFVYAFPILYYHPFGDNGLYELNLETYQATLLLDYFGGDFIDANSNYIFVDYGHTSIWRYNLSEDSVDVQNDLLGSSGNYLIQGIAVYDSLVYVITSNKLYTLNLNLQLLKTIDVPSYYYSSLSYYNGFLYSLIYLLGERLHLIKIDPDTGTIVDENLSPALDNYTIKIYSGVLYFIENKQQVLCYTWLDDIFPE